MTRSEPLFTGTSQVLALHCQAVLQLDQAKTDVVRLVRDRGSDDALKALPVYNDGQMYEWTGSRDRCCSTRPKATK
jgi:hypothetical protein